MLIFPAIDLYDKKAVRLFKGDYNQMTVYSENPLEVAMGFKKAGAEYIHMVDLDGKDCEFSSTDFSDFDVNTLERLLTVYFEYMLKTVYENDFSVLCHVTYPLRYINGAYKKGITLDRYINRIEDIYKVIIDKNTALEINTARCTDENPYAFCPERSCWSFIFLSAAECLLSAPTAI
ncbi:MAG: hypothetical protein IJZ20_03980 [Clostridia bacterium]|nr:hypothetical protein [Clostridia bacterium]